jgi:predicted ArsR family transcriptional regulator
MSTRFMQTYVCINRVLGYNQGVKSTRQRVIEYLQRRQQACAVEISHALHLTAADIRHHLSLLEDEGVVDVVDQRPATGRGRPTSFYQLTRQALLNNLDGLSKALIAETQHILPEAEKDAFYKRVAQQLLGNDYQPARNPSQRFVNAIHFLNQKNYQARWEARADAPQVIFSHCPYAAVQSEHPELCQIDAYLLSLLLASPIKQTARLQPNPQGFPQCFFSTKKL